MHSWISCPIDSKLSRFLPAEEISTLENSISELLAILGKEGDYVLVSYILPLILTDIHTPTLFINSLF